MRLSIIIPAINEASTIGRAVESAWKAGVGEVLVADGGSSDQTRQIAAARGALVIEAPRGRASQQNAAARIATGDVLLFLHADNWLEDHVSLQIRGALADPRRTHGALRQRIDAAGMGYRVLEWGNSVRVRYLGLPYGDQAIFVRREAFQAVGGFPDMPLMEDLALMRRLRKEAWPVLLPGPVHVSARRWERHGVVRQTLRNWRLVTAYLLGARPDRLATAYRRHDE